MNRKLAGVVIGTGGSNVSKIRRESKAKVWAGRGRRRCITVGQRAPCPALCMVHVYSQCAWCLP